ncbi:AI-2E family transporter [Geodermatophilus saharensis]|uniref:AI-2E family transporter n=1 Tax=Geodermatophilus saharensis TaxID=1137994 RepID=UPI001FE5748A|nr:AI-2E family transporter [Geodermatophilus saharensis]
MPASDVPDEADAREVPAVPSSPPAADGAGPGRWSAEPPWLRRVLLLALLAVAAYQVAGWAFTHLRGFLGLVFLAWMFSISIEPAVHALTRRGLRRGAATGLVVLGVVVLVIGLVAAFGTLLVDQLAGLVSSLPDVIRDVVEAVNRTFGTTLQPGDVVDSLQLTPSRVQQVVQDLTPGVVGIVTAVIGAVFQTLTFLLFAYYMSAQAPALRDTVSRRFPPRQQRVIATVWDIAVEKTGGYVFSRLLLALLSAFVTAVFLLVLGVPFWLPLALWTGLVSQFIPTVGTYLAIGLPAVVALAGQPSDALWVVVFGAAYQQVENYLVGPRITARTVHVHPAVALGSVIVGVSLLGAMGALVAIPVVAAVQAVIETYGHRYELVADDGPGVPQRVARRRWRGVLRQPR